MKRRIIVNISGALGYIATVFCWLWSTIIVLTSTNIMESLTTKRQPESYPEFMLPEFSFPEPVVYITVLIITIFMIGLSIYAVYKAPTEAVKQTSRATKKTASSLATLIHRAEEQPKEKQKILSAKLAFYIKLTLVFVPVLAVAITTSTNASNIQLPAGIAIMISASGGLFAIVFFGLQYSLAKLLKVPPNKLI